MTRDASRLLVLGLALLFFASSKGGARGASRPTKNPRTGKPIVTPGTRKLSDDELRSLIAMYGFRDAAQAFALAKRESGGYADVVVDTRGMSADELKAYWGKPALPELSVGLWQINTLSFSKYDPELLKSPDANAIAAFELSNGGSSWGPWRQG